MNLKKRAWSSCTSEQSFFTLEVARHSVRLSQNSSVNLNIKKKTSMKIGKAWGLWNSSQYRATASRQFHAIVHYEYFT